MNDGNNTRIITICMVLIACILTATALYWLKPVMVPLVLAVLLTYMLAPVVDWLVGTLRFPRYIAVFVTLGLAGLSIFLVGGMISNSVKTLANKAPVYEQHIREKAESVVNWIEYKGYDVNPQNIESRLDELPIANILAGATNTLLDLITNTFLILVFVIYLLQGRDPARRKGRVASQIETRIKHYLLIKTVLSLATGFLTAVILFALNIELAMVFGVLAFILNFVPNVGSIVATLLPIPVVLVDPNFEPIRLILAIGLPGTVQMTVGNILEPKMLGDSLDLHPITVLLSLIFWGMLWGVPGLLLAAPITAVLKILSENQELTTPVARLLSGKLSPEDPPETTSSANEEEEQENPPVCNDDDAETTESHNVMPPEDSITEDPVTEDLVSEDPGPNPEPEDPDTKEPEES